MADKKQQIRETLEAYASIIRLEDEEDREEADALFRDLVAIMEA